MHFNHSFVEALVREIRARQRNLQIPALLSHGFTHGSSTPYVLCPVDQSPSVQNCSPKTGFGGSPPGSKGGARAHAGSGKLIAVAKARIMEAGRAALGHPGSQISGGMTRLWWLGRRCPHSPFDTC